MVNGEWWLVNGASYGQQCIPTCKRSTSIRLPPLWQLPSTRNPGFVLGVVYWGRGDHEDYRARTSVNVPHNLREIRFVLCQRHVLPAVSGLVGGIVSAEEDGNQQSRHPCQVEGVARSRKIVH
jgi:hypothetical protein